MSPGIATYESRVIVLGLLPPSTPRIGSQILRDRNSSAVQIDDQALASIYWEFGVGIPFVVTSAKYFCRSTAIVSFTEAQGNEISALGICNWCLGHGVLGKRKIGLIKKV